MWKTGETLLLDTSVVILGFKQNENVRKTLEDARQLFMPLPCYGELYFGALNSGNPVKKLAQLHHFMNIVQLLEGSQTTAEMYGDVRLKLKNAGKPIPENDIWIAAFALQHNLVLFTADAHFDSVESLKTLKSW